MRTSSRTSARCRKPSHFIRIIPRNGLLLGNGDDPESRAAVERDALPGETLRSRRRQCYRHESSLWPDGERVRDSEREVPSEPRRRTQRAQRAGGRGGGETLQADEQKIQAPFDTFKGIKRRMEVRGISGGVTVIDDFGHHPTAIRETLRALRVKYREGENLGHLRAAQQHDAAECLSAELAFVRGCRWRDCFADRTAGVAQARGAFESPSN